MFFLYPYFKIFSINEWSLLQFKNNTVDTLTNFENDVQGFQMGDRLYVIDKKNILSEIIINNANSDNKVLIKKVDHCEKYFKKGMNIQVFQDLPLDDVFIIVDQKLFRISLIGSEFSFELILDNLPIKEYYKIETLRSVLMIYSSS